MKQEDFDKTIDGIITRCRKILTSRRGQYATDADVLHNFKMTSTVLSACGFQLHGRALRATDVTLLFTLIKAMRLATQLGLGRDGRDTRDDLINYILLGEACEIDEKEQGVRS